MREAREFLRQMEDELQEYGRRALAAYDVGPDPDRDVLKRWNGQVCGVIAAVRRVENSIRDYDQRDRFARWAEGVNELVLLWRDVLIERRPADDAPSIDWDAELQKIS